MTKLDTETKLQIIKDIVEGRKAENIEVIDLQGRTLIADYFVLASGTSNVHIKAIVDKVVEDMKKEHGVRAHRVEGYSEAKWVLVDFGDVVLHVLANEEREFYDLESLWRVAEEKLAARQ
jgi:ribosome-associated protein